jgi:hypothetical protein
MSRKSLIAAVTGAAVITTAVLAVNLAMSSGGAPNVESAPGHTQASAAAPLKQATVVSPVQDRACRLGAVPDLAGLDARVVDAAAVTGFAQPLRAGSSPLSRDAAIKFAQSRADSDAGISHPSAAVSVPYSTAGDWFGDRNQLIAPSRCVWVVTVKAPFTPSHQLHGSKAIELDVYSLILDQASGQYVGMMAGPETPNMITGVVPSRD